MVADRWCYFNLKEREDGRRRGMMIVCTNKRKGKEVWEHRKR
jgi:hypothetical protein